jgi:hypothetical protein
VLACREQAPPCRGLTTEKSRKMYEKMVKYRYTTTAMLADTRK